MSYFYQSYTSIMGSQNAVEIDWKLKHRLAFTLRLNARYVEFSVATKERSCICLCSLEVYGKSQIKKTAPYSTSNHLVRRLDSIVGNYS